MWYIRLSFLLWLACYGISIFAQNKEYSIDRRKRIRQQSYPSPYDFRQWGWLFDGGLAGTFATNTPLDMLLDGIDTSYTRQIRPGALLNIGVYYSLKDGRSAIRYIDASAGYKMLWYSVKQKTEQLNTQVQTKTQSFFFLSHSINFNAHINNTISLGRYFFIQNSLGFNIDQRFIESTNAPLSGNKLQSFFIAQAQFKIGIGYMLNTDFAVIPYLEVPFLNLYPKQSMFSQIDYLNHPFQTVIIGLRFMLFRFGQKGCPKAITTEGKAKNNGY